MDVRQLRQFIAVAEELNFRKAAERLGIAQPPLTAAIKKIENEIGVRLLDRTNRISGLTDAGEVFLEESRRTLEQLSKAIQLAREAEHGKMTVFRLSFVDSAAGHILPKIVHTLRLIFPRVDLDLTEAATIEQLRDLKEGRIDAGIVALPITQSGKVRLSKIFIDKMVIALPSTHRLATLQEIRLSDLEADEWIIFSIHQALHDLIVKACMKAGFVPRIAQRARQIQTALGLVAAGVGVALIPRSSARALPGVVFAELKGAKVNYEIALAYNNSSPIIDGILAIRHHDLGATPESTGNGLASPTRAPRSRRTPPQR